MYLSSKHNKHIRCTMPRMINKLTLSLLLTLIVPYANSLDPDEICQVTRHLI